jgi:hypothetical protein
MPKFLEKKLKKEYGENSKAPYKVMNAIGAMHGNKETAKGAEMEAKHKRKMDTESSTYDWRKHMGRPKKGRWAR